MKLIGGWRGCPFLKSFYITKYKENAEILLVKKGKKKVLKNIVKQLVCLRIISFTLYKIKKPVFYNAQHAQIAF